MYQVDRVRDGRSFTTRRVVSVQHGEVIFILSASFQAPEEGFEHQVPMPSAPDPETLPTFQERYAPYRDELAGWYSRPRPIDVRYVGDVPRAAVDRAARNEGPQEPRSQVWMRTDGPLPDDPLLHVCAVTYASDMTLLDSVLLSHGVAWSTGQILGASLDHAMWFHRPFRADEWFLYDQDSPSASGGRGLARGEIFTRDGRLAVSVVQEGVIRRRASCGLISPAGSANPSVVPDRGRTVVADAGTRRPSGADESTRCADRQCARCPSTAWQQSDRARAIDALDVRPTATGRSRGHGTHHPDPSPVAGWPAQPTTNDTGGASAGVTALPRTTGRPPAGRPTAATGMPGPTVPSSTQLAPTRRIRTRLQEPFGSEHWPEPPSAHRPAEVPPTRASGSTSRGRPRCPTARPCPSSDRAAARRGPRRACPRRGRRPTRPAGTGQAPSSAPPTPARGI